MTSHDEGKLESSRFIARLKRRDEAAFSELVLILEKRIFRLVWRMLGQEEEARDVTQEVFVQVFRNLPGFRSESKLSTWVYRIAINTTKNRFKYLDRRAQKSHDEWQVEKPGHDSTHAQGFTVAETTRPDQVAEANQAEKIVIECLGKLEAEYREILILRDVEALSYDEVGQIMGLADGTVKSRLHRARKQLRQQIEARLKGVL